MLVAGSEYAAKKSMDDKQVFIGVVSSVDSEGYLMSVDVEGLGTLKGIPINTPQNIVGSGLTVLPTVSITTVILYKTESKFIHIGYYYQSEVGGAPKGLTSLFDSATQDKNTPRVPRRNMRQGEVILSGPENNYAYFDIEGNIRLSAEDGTCINILTLERKIENFCSIFYIESNSMNMSVGDCSREGELISDIDGLVKKESDLGDEEALNPIKEHRVEMLDVTSILGQKVVKKDGTEQKEKGKSLNKSEEYLSGFKIYVTVDGDYIIKNNVTELFLKHTGECYITNENVNFNMLPDGALNFTNPTTKVSISPEGSIDIECESNVSVNSKGDVSLKSEGDIDIESEGDFNIKSEGDFNIKSDGDAQFKVTGNTEFDVDGDVNIKSLGNIKMETLQALILKTLDSGIWQPNILPACLLTGAPHGGPGAGITQLKGIG